MLKIGKTARIFLAGGILVIAYAAMLNSYFRQAEEPDLINQDFNSVRILLSKVNPEEFASKQMNLESQIAQAESELLDSKDMLYHSIESSEVIDNIFILAAANEVDIQRIGSSIIERKQQGDITYSALSVTSFIHGYVPNILELMRQLSNEFPTIIIETVGMELSGSSNTTSANTTSANTTDKPLVNINMFIHTIADE